MSASDVAGIFLGFTVQSPNRVSRITIELNGQMVHEKLFVASNGAQESGTAIKARGVPPGIYQLRVRGEDVLGCFAYTGAVRMLQVTP